MHQSRPALPGVSARRPGSARGRLRKELLVATLRAAALTTNIVQSTRLAHARSRHTSFLGTPAGGTFPGCRYSVHVARYRDGIAQFRGAAFARTYRNNRHVSHNRTSCQVPAHREEFRPNLRVARHPGRVERKTPTGKFSGLTADCSLAQRESRNRNSLGVDREPPRRVSRDFEPATALHTAHLWDSKSIIQTSE